LDCLASIAALTAQLGSDKEGKKEARPSLIQRLDSHHVHLIPANFVAALQKPFKPLAHPQVYSIPSQQGTLTHSHQNRTRM